MRSSVLVFGARGVVRLRLRNPTAAEHPLDKLHRIGPALGPAAPVVLGFLDAGWYSGLHKSPTFGDASGTLASAGGGLALGIGPGFHGGVYGGILVPGDDPLFPVYVPDGGRGFFSAMFTLHF